MDATPGLPERPNGNGRERFEGTVGGQKVSFVVRDLLSILLLVGIFVLGFIVWQQLSLGLRLLHGQHRQIEEMLDEQNELLREHAHVMAQFFYALDYNQGRPADQRIPLRLERESLPLPQKLTPRQREEKVLKEMQEKTPGQ